MSSVKRIALNVAATYGRSLVALVCGLLTGRWALMSLGVVDYGIFGVVGGLVVFVTFFNGVLAGAVARFYAVSAGKVHECRRWFTVAVGLHAVVPLGLLAVGYPLGAWAVAHGLTIPADRVSDALWVWRLICLGSLVTMASVPFNAMFVAKQRFGELSAYGIAVSVVQVGVLAYMVTHPGSWLVPLAGWTCLASVLPGLVIAFRACRLFDECRIVRAHLWNRADIAELGRFVGWMTLGGFGLVLRDSGMTILVNKLFGPARNAALAVANTASGHAASLTASVQQVFVPAIATAYGSGDRAEFARLSQAACKFCGLSLLPFVLPLMLEADEVLALWLKTPPDGAASLCVLILLSVVIDRIGCGLWASIEASGRVSAWQTGCCLIKIVGLALAGGLAAAGCGLDAIGIALMLIAAAESVFHLVLVRLYLGFSVLKLMRTVFVPLAAVASLAAAAGSLPRILMNPSLGRVVLTTLAANGVLLPLAWKWALCANERDRVRAWVRRLLSRPPGERRT